MKVSGFWLLFFMFGAALMFLHLSTRITGSFGADTVFVDHFNSRLSSTTRNRKLKEDGDNLGNRKNSNVVHYDLDDYHLVHPVPSSNASVRPKPIEHGTPVIPYIPKPAPPGHPSHGGST